MSVNSKSAVKQKVSKIKRSIIRVLRKNAKINNYFCTKEGFKELEIMLQRYSPMLPTIIKWAGDQDGFSEEIKFFEKNGFEVFPYEWVKKRRDIIKNTFMWSDGEYSYVKIAGKKLYLDSKMSFSQLILEQFPQCGHKYFGGDFSVPEGAVMVDIGASEGMISLENIEKLSHVFLIEADPRWEAMERKTFAQYLDKVEIVSKYASNVDDDRNICIDSLLKEIDAPIVIKIDVEGMEWNVLDGLLETLKRKKVLIAVASYHRSDDASRLYELFVKLGYSVEMSDGYGYLGWKDEPYLRKLIVRAKNY